MEHGWLVQLIQTLTGGTGWVASQSHWWTDLKQRRWDLEQIWPLLCIYSVNSLLICDNTPLLLIVVHSSSVYLSVCVHQYMGKLLWWYLLHSLLHQLTNVPMHNAIWISQKEPFQSGLPKHLEGYDAGALSGDMEYAISCLYQYASCALNSCGEELGLLDQSIRLYIKRAIQYKHILPAKVLAMWVAQVECRN